MPKTTRADTYLGSKSQRGTWRRICSLMPAHRVYFEPFLGSGKIMGEKRPAEWEIGTDIDPQTITDWRRRPHFRAAPIVLQADALGTLSSFSAVMDPTWFIYVDAPYPLNLRSRHRYRFEPEEKDPKWHNKLLALLTELPCRVMVSCFWNPHYVSMLQEWHGWRADSFMSSTRGGVSQEWLWMNYPADVPLHDTRHVGRGFRERERITRKRKRWVSRFLAMPPAERQVIAEALAIVSADHAVSDDGRSPMQNAQPAKAGRLASSLFS